MGEIGPEMADIPIVDFFGPNNPKKLPKPGAWEWHLNLHFLILWAKKAKKHNPTVWE
jgi:hypothetical protein